MKKIIIDTDPGIDDALAIMLAVRSNLFDIKAITTVMGNSSIENTTNNAEWILECLNEKNIRVYSGSAAPLEGNFSSSFVMGEGGLGGLVSKKESKLGGNAVDKILEIVENNPGEITIVAIGPLTNIASAIIKNSQIMKKVKEIIIMGGAIKVNGNMSRVAEFNIFNDALAADIVFNFAVPKILIPLDLCNQVELTDTDFNKIYGDLRKPILAMTGNFMDRLKTNETGKKVALVYDALAIYYLINPIIYQLEELDVRIETQGKLTRGMTVADFRPVSKKENNFKVAFGINKLEFVNDFINILSFKTNIKVIEKAGKTSGKNTVILAGVHGNEVCGIEAFEQLIPKLEIENGNVTFIFANLEAINQNKRQIDKNLNRCFLKDPPIDLANSLEGRTALEIMPYLEKADLMLDLHASFTENSIPFVICDEKQINKANIFDTNTVTFNWDPFEPGSTDYYLNLQGKPGFCFECGYSGYKTSVETAKKAIINFLRFTKNIVGTPEITLNQRIFRIKSLYKNKCVPFKPAKPFADFELFDEKTLVGFDGYEKIYLDSGDIILFICERNELNKECFLVAQDVSKETLINNDNLGKSLKEIK